METTKKGLLDIIFLVLLIFTFPIQKKILTIDLGFHLKSFQIVLMLGFFVFVLRWIKNRELVSFRPKVKQIINWFLIFLIVIIPQILLSEDVTGGIRNYIALIWVSLAFFLTIYIVKEKSDLIRLFKIGSIAGILFGILGVILYISKSHFGNFYFYGKIPRLINLHDDPNFYAMHASFFFFIGLTYYYFSNRFNKLIGFACLLLSGLNVVLTFSRGGIASLILAFVIFLMFLFRKNFGTKTNSLVLGGISISGVLIIALSQKNLVSTLVERVNSLQIDAGSGRLGLWSTGWKLFTENPILGIGLGNFRYYNWIINHSERYIHNSYLQILVETGLVGFIIFAIFASKTLLNSFQLQKKVQNKNWLLVFGPLCAFIAIALQSFFLSSFFDVAFWFALGIVVACLNINKEFLDD